MQVKETVEKYFKALHTGDWESYIADDFTFINSNLDKVAHGKEAYLHGAGRFFKTTTSVEVRQILVDGNKVAVIARYTIRSPKANSGVCDVAEFITVADNKLVSSAIFFDTKSLAEFMAE